MIEANTFAEACYNQNSLDELLEAYFDAEADQSDCESWGIDEQKWMDSIEKAMGEKMREFFCENNNSKIHSMINSWAKKPEGYLSIDEEGDIVSPSGAAMTIGQTAGFFKKTEAHKKA
ncbi:hypothetical protein SAMN05660443_0233 [Marinospirillum celere]|uniref:Uncharacterized protein n=1 Tax=Marinospirillum celere TaxID=1122252 RepID=A0A1I1E051_9GAMM|nr:hypothetical protein [Marinospirillum celere]SFB80447.1 hypothetical protein SAMN05660443_0233 [Marinospirillum celere]